jgi:serine/threonine protein kinase
MSRPVGIVTGRPVELLGKPRTLGEGSYGLVRRYETTRGPIAVKVAKDGKGGISPSLLREAVALASLKRHPNVISLLDAYVTAREMAIITPYADASLDGWIEGGRLQEGTRTDKRLVKLIAIQVVRGLMYLHSRDLIHADVKTGNVLLIEGEGCSRCEGERCTLRAMLSDLGSSRTSRCFELDRPLYAGSLLENPPEYLLGGSYTQSGDVWALGCTIGEMLLGSAVFDDAEADELDVSDVLSRQVEVLGAPTPVTWPGLESLPGYSRYRRALGRGGEGTVVGEGTVGGEGTVVGGGTGFTTAALEDDDEVSVSPEDDRFLRRMLVMNPRGRASLLELLRDEWFDEIRALAAEPCLEAPHVEPLVCSTMILAREASDLVSFPYSAATRPAIYGWFVYLQRTNASYDRTRSLAVWMFEHLSSLRGARGDVHAEEVQAHAAACYYVASTLLDPRGLEADSISRLSNGLIPARRVLDLSRRVVEIVGLDMYVATSRDVLMVLLEGAQERVKDAALTYLQLSYYSGLSLSGTEVAALACVLLAYVYLDVDTAAYPSRLEEVGVDRIRAAAAEEVGKNLSQALRDAEEITDVATLLLSAQRGTFSSTQLLKGNTLTGEWYAWMKE